MSRATKMIEDYTRGCSNELYDVEDKYGNKVITFGEWLSPEQALRAVEIEREELVDKVCEWIVVHIRDYTIYNPYLGGVVNNDFFSDLKKAMKGE